MGALVLVAVAGAGFAIASLNDGEEPQKNKASLAEKRDQRNEERLEREVSDLKDEVSQLKEDQETEPPVAQAPDSQPPTSSGGGSSGGGDFAGYIAQLGSFRELGNAKQQLESILSQGGGGGIIWSSDFVQMVPGYWVVYSGPYDTQSEADQVAASSGISDAFGRYISVR